MVPNLFIFLEVLNIKAYDFLEAVTFTYCWWKGHFAKRAN